MCARSGPRLLAVLLSACVLPLLASGCSRSDPFEQPARLLGTPLTIIDQSDTTHHFQSIVAAGILDTFVVVAHASSEEIRLFSLDGAFVRSFGGSGSGELQFEQLNRVWLRGDSIVAYDIARRRVTVWNALGELQRELEIFSPWRVVAEGMLDDGSVVGWTLRPSVGFPAGSTALDSATLLLFAPDGGSYQIIGRMPWATQFAATLPNGRPLWGQQHFAPRGHMAVTDSTVLLGYGGDANVLRMKLDGSVDTLGIARTRQPFPDEASAAFRESLIEQLAPSDVPLWRSYYETLPLPDSLPGIDGMLVDEETRIWLRAAPLPDRDVATWVIYDSDGDDLFSLQIETTALPVWASSDRVVLVQKRAGRDDIVEVHALPAG